MIHRQPVHEMTELVQERLDLLLLQIALLAAAARQVGNERGRRQMLVLHPRPDLKHGRVFEFSFARMHVQVKVAVQPVTLEHPVGADIFVPDIGLPGLDPNAPQVSNEFEDPVPDLAVLEVGPQRGTVQRVALLADQVG